MGAHDPLLITPGWGRYVGNAVHHLSPLTEGVHASALSRNGVPIDLTKRGIERVVGAAIGSCVLSSWSAYIDW